jgi:hypothetical protein
VQHIIQVFLRTIKAPSPRRPPYTTLDGVLNARTWALPAGNFLVIKFGELRLDLIQRIGKHLQLDFQQQITQTFHITNQRKVFASPCFIQRQQKTACNALCEVLFIRSESLGADVNNRTDCFACCGNQHRERSQQ